MGERLFEVALGLVSWLAVALSMMVRVEVVALVSASATLAMMTTSTATEKRCVMHSLV
jgi:hypothetical protein